MATVDLKLRVLGRKLTREITCRESEHVNGGRIEPSSPCIVPYCLTGYDNNGLPICDPPISTP